jgi:hypothetical protein
MVRHRIAAIVPLATIAIVAPGALAAQGLSGTYSTKITAPAMIKGTWSVNFHNGKTKISRNGQPRTAGAYTISGSTITFNKPTKKSGCHKPGKYSFSVTGNQLKFTKISDPCFPRNKILARTFTKV